MKKEKSNLKQGIIGRLGLVLKKSEIEHYIGTTSLRTCAKAAIATILASGAVGGLAYYATAVPSSPLPVEKGEKRRESLEELMRTTEQVMVKAVYKSKSGQELPLYFGGSAVCIYKNTDENLAFYLTCSHVLDVPKELNIIGFFSSSPGAYRVDARTGDDKQIPLAITAFEQASSGNYALDSLECGLVDGYNMHINGFPQSPKLIKVTTLADTLISDETNWIYDEDVALLKVSEREVAAQPDRFRVFTGEFADGAELAPGSRLWTIGFPMDLGKQVCSGEVRCRDDPNSDYDDTYTLMTVPINPGNSGGPVFLENELQEVLDDGTVKTTKGYKLAGLARLGYFDSLAMTGMCKIEKIKNFLREEGYSYIYKR